MSFKTLQDELRDEGYKAGLAGQPIETTRTMRESQRAAWEMGWRAGNQDRRGQGGQEPQGVKESQGERTRYAITLRPCKCLHLTAVITVAGGAATAKCYACGEPIRLRKERKT
jgi:ribosome modulation factor